MPSTECAVDAVADGLVRQIFAGKLAVGGRGIGVLIVGDDEDERQFFNGGLVQSFVKRAGGSRAVAEAGRADGAGNFFETTRKQHAVHDGNHRAEMADHRQIAFARPAAMDIAVAPAHRAERGAEVVAHGVNDGFAKSQAAGAVADERGKNIGFFERHADGGAQGFLAAAEKNAAVDFAGAVKRGEFVIQQPRPQHEAESGELSPRGQHRLSQREAR